MKKNGIQIYGLFVGWTALIFVASSIPGDSIPMPSIWSFDKLVHSMVFAVLAILSLKAFSFYGLKRGWTITKILVTSFGFCVLYAASDELHQLFTPLRSSDVLDFLADSTGIVVVHGAMAFRNRHMTI